MHYSTAADDPPSISVTAGIVIGLLASLVQSLGLTIQRKSHVQNDELPEEERKVEHKRPLWLLGFGIFILSNILGSIFQIASLPVVILAPLGAVSLLWNAFFARLLLGDVFSHYMAIGTLLIAGGAVLIAIFGVVPEPTHSLDDLLRLFGRQAFIVYFSLLGFALASVLVITHIVEYRLPAVVIPDSPNLTPIPEVDDNLSLPTERTPLLIADNKPVPPTVSAHARTRMWLAISYASASGILSGLCLLFAKSGVELLVLTVAGHNQFWRWESWALVGGLVVFALLQLLYLHKSLILADPTLVCPLAFCFYNLSSIFNGLVYFDQFGALTTPHLILVLVGISILLAGVWAVSMQSGGPRVEVGTWQEGTEVLTSEATGVASAAAAPTVHPRSPTLDRSWHSTVRRSHAYTDEPGEIIGEEVPLLPGSNIGSASTPVSPLYNAQFPSPTPSQQSPKRPVLRRRLQSKWRSIFLDSHSHQQGSIGGGLSIGLSPASPGFAIVPTTRRRRVSGDQGIVEEELEPGRGTWRPRRTLSESDVHHRWSHGPLAEEGGESLPRTSNDLQTRDAISNTDKKRGVFGWVRSFFR